MSIKKAKILELVSIESEHPVRLAPDNAEGVVHTEVDVDF